MCVDFKLQGLLRVSVHWISICQVDIILFWMRTSIIILDTTQFWSKYASSAGCCLFVQSSGVVEPTLVQFQGDSFNYKFIICLWMDPLYIFVLSLRLYSVESVNRWCWWWGCCSELHQPKGEIAKKAKNNNFLLSENYNDDCRDCATPQTSMWWRVDFLDKYLTPFSGQNIIILLQLLEAGGE